MIYFLKCKLGLRLLITGHCCNVARIAVTVFLLLLVLAALKFCFKTCVAMKFVDDDDDDDDYDYALRKLSLKFFLLMTGQFRHNNSNNNNNNNNPIPWKNGRYVTVTDTLAQSYLPATSGSSGAATEAAAERKMTKYWHLAQSYTLIPVAVETLGPINNNIEFLGDLGRRISQVSNDRRQSAFLFQRLSVLIQRFNMRSLSKALSPTEDDI